MCLLRRRKSKKNLRSKIRVRVNSTLILRKWHTAERRSLAAKLRRARSMRNLLLMKISKMNRMRTMMILMTLMMSLI